MIKAANFFTQEQQDAIVKAIANAEQATSGEIRVHLSTKCKSDVLDEAAWLFHKLGMDKTADRNGVLIYMAVNDHKFAIIGDKGINSVVPLDFWDSVRDHMKKRFLENLFAEGLTEGILMAGKLLSDHFPHKKDDINEITDTISFDNNEIQE